MSAESSTRHWPMARKTVLYIAASLDGYIASDDGSIEWLVKYDSSISGYDEFISTVDTVVMGYATFRQLTEELSVGVWPYEGMDAYVVSSRDHENRKEVTFVKDPIKLVEELKRKDGKTIWIVGGAKLAHSLFDAGLIDELVLTIVPESIGKGIPLFPKTPMTLQTIQTKHYGPFVEITYTIKSNK